MSELNKITNYATTTNSILPSRFSGKTAFPGILGINDNQLQDLEDANYEILNNIWLDTAVGSQLDLLGGILALERNGRDDETYRALLYLKVDVNTGSGEPELLIKAVKQLYGATAVHYIPNYPAGVIIEQNGAIGLFLLVELEIDDGGFLILDDGLPLYLRTTDTTAEYLLDLIVPAGVELEIINV